MPHVRIHVAAGDKMVQPLCDALTKAGFGARGFRNRNDLLAVRDDRPNVYVISTRLEDGPGLAAFQELREPRAPPVVFVAYPDEVSRRGELLDLGAADVMVAPFRSSALVSRVVELAGGQLRAEPRHEVEMPADLEIGRHTQRVATVDLSRSGLAVLADRPLPLKTLGAVVLHPSDATPLRLFVRVLHCREKAHDPQRRHVVGLRLLAMTRSEETALDAILAAVPAPPQPELPVVPSPAEAAPAPPPVVLSPAPPEPAPKPKRKSRRAAVAAASLAGIAAVSVGVGFLVRETPMPPLPAGVSIDVAGRTAVLRLAAVSQRAPVSELTMLAGALRPRGFRSALLVDRDGRPLAAFDLADPKPVRWAGEPSAVGGP